MIELNVESITGWFSDLTSSFIATPIYYLSIGLAVAAILLFLYYTFGNVKSGHFWYGLFFGGVAVAVALIAQNYVGLFDVIYLGLTMSNNGAMLFVLGMGALMAVIGYNLLMTGGKQAVR